MGKDGETASRPPKHGDNSTVTAGLDRTGQRTRRGLSFTCAAALFCCSARLLLSVKRSGGLRPTMTERKAKRLSSLLSPRWPGSHTLPSPNPTRGREKGKQG